MYTINARNVNEALALGTMLLTDLDPQPKPSRAGDVIEYVSPVATVYRKPTERVLFNEARDANPFFHLMESLWILAGNNDVEWLAHYNNRMREYSDNGITFHAAYGHRLRHARGFDQIEQVIKTLQADPDSRRAVLQIWDAHSDLGTVSKDIPCNDLVMFKIRNGRLQMTVANRSNDMIWGAYGANAVQFSMIQEYIASSLYVGVGCYTQVSDSFHVYVDGPGGKVWDRVKATNTLWHDPYVDSGVAPFPLMSTDPDNWNDELSKFMTSGYEEVYTEPFFEEVAAPVACVWDAYKDGDHLGALMACDAIAASDWRLACKQWLQRRAK